MSPFNYLFSLSFVPLLAPNPGDATEGQHPIDVPFSSHIQRNSVDMTAQPADDWQQNADVALIQSQRLRDAVSISI